ncbi:MAG: phosphopantetheine-binding protein, partial [Gammaproteobacteria bacterium]|nr:phosphopantetheine-binding protein [Gammaproteobacteria bacterium]
QVKIGGHRVELGEIEAQLMKHPLVKQAVVDVVRDEREVNQLVGYVVPKSTSRKIDFINGATITGESERLEFKLKSIAMRDDLLANDTLGAVNLYFAEDDENAWFFRKSYRNYMGDFSRVDLLLCLNLAVQSLDPLKSVKAMDHFNELSKVLSIFSAVKEKHSGLLKYRYPSAGGLYPVQIYIKCTERDANENLVSDVYYLHPKENKLLLLEKSKKQTERSTFELYFVINLEAITPLYGELSLTLGLLEIGYMLGLLKSGCKKNKLTYSYGALKKQEIDFDVGANNYWAVAPISLSSSDKGETTEGSLLKSLRVYLFVKNDNQKQSIGWYRYDVYGATLIPIREKPYFNESELAGDNNKIFDNADFALFFTTKMTMDEQSNDLHVLTGMFVQILSEIFLKNGIGICPIGSLSLDLEKKYFNDEQLLHIVYGGAVSDEQLNEKVHSKTGADDALSSSSLLLFLSSKLPPYMFPKNIVFADEIPLSYNGKLDRRSLVNLNAAYDNKKFAQPVTHIDFKLVEICANILSLDVGNISMNANFIELGGDSLGIIKFGTKIKEEFTVQISIKELFVFRDLKQLSEKIHNTAWISNDLNDQNFFINVDDLS